jgi:hypothetical protein
VIPIDPVLAIVGDRAPEHVVARVREELGLNKPLWEQFYIYVNKVVHGDFGTSVLTSNPVMQDIAARFPRHSSLRRSASSSEQESAFRWEYGPRSGVAASSTRSCASWGSSAIRFRSSGSG